MAQTYGISTRLLVLNDQTLPSDRLPPLNLAIGCNCSKTRFLRETLRQTRDGYRVLSTQVRLLPATMLATSLRPRLQYDVVLHGLEVWHDIPLLASLGLRRARRAYCVSRYTANRVAEQFPSLRPRLRVLPNPVDPDLATRLKKIPPDTAEPGRILAVSRLSTHDQFKGIDHLIAALPIIRKRQPNTTLHIVGDGEDRRRLSALAAASPARSFIFFHGKINDADLINQFAYCSVFALPSDKEGFGLVYAEALTAGRPCIAARAGGAPEVLGDDGEAGFLVPYGNVNALAQACCDALIRQWDSDKLRARADAFNLERFQQRLIEIWKEP